MEAPGFIIFPDLYKNKTYLIDENRPYLVTILVDDATSVYMDDADRELLEKILQSVNISLAKTKVVNIQNLDTVVMTKFSFPAPKIISFGVDLAQFGYQATPRDYELSTINEQTFLTADPLFVIAKNKQKKIQLWQALKQMFTDK